MQQCIKEIRSVIQKAVYAGSFDPITKGHMWMIEQGAKLFDRLTVAVGTNPDKTYTFTLEERVQMVQEAVGNLERVSIDDFGHQFLVHYAHTLGAQFILRGIRNERDYEYERGMRNVNSDLQPEIVTVFLMPPREIAEISSSLVKGMIGPEGWQSIVRRYLPEPTYRTLLAKFEEEVADR
jgi:pantetheine-phosphate adenylyltransferase